MVGDLRPLIVVVKLLVLVPSHQGALFAENFGWVTLIAKTHDFLIIYHRRASVADGKDFPISAKRKLFCLVLCADQRKVREALPVHIHIDCL